MKYTFSKIAIVIFISSLAYANSQAQIPNQDMEFWSNIGLGGESPTDWYSSNGDLVPSNVFKDSIDKYSGTYSAMMTNVIGIPASLGCNFTATSHPVELKGFFKNDFQTPDTAFIKIVLYNNSLASDSGELLITSDISSWSAISIPISNTSAITDSVSISISACNQQQNKFWVDHLSFTNPSSVMDESELSISVFPNPFVSRLTVSSCQSADCSITISDYLGRKFFEAQASCSNGTDIINLNSLSSGIYFLEIRNDKNYLRQKIVKQ